MTTSPAPVLHPLNWEELETQRERFSDMLDSFLFGIVLLDEKLRIRMMNAEARAILGISGPVRAQQFTRFIPPDDRPMYDDMPRRLARGERALRLEHGILPRNGSTRRVQCFFTAFPMQEPGKFFITLALMDMTEQKEMQERCAASERRYRMLFDVAADAIMVISPEGILLDVNDMVCAHSGKTREQLIGQSVHSVFTPARRQLVAANIAETLEKGARTFEALMISPDSPIPMEINAQLIEYQGQAAVLGIARDITERKILQARLEYQAATDPLTALHNRRHFLLKAEQEFLRFKRYGNAFAMLMLDLDHFKDVNDTYGHQTGDALLREFARQMRVTFRHSDILGRIGGEEFSVLLLESSLHRGIEIAERLRRQVEQHPLESPGGQVRYTVSIGVTTASAADAGLEVIMRRADTALYRAKRNGRNQVEFDHAPKDPSRPVAAEEQPFP